MTTTIHANGSKSADEAPDPIEVLIDRLKCYKLNPIFAPFATSSATGSAMVLFRGNFEDYSHAFSIETDDLDVVMMLGEAIQQNAIAYGIRGVTSLWDWTQANKP